MDEYEKQAQNFLRDTETALTVKISGKQGAPLWGKDGEKHGIKYDVVLKNARGSYAFPFWDSIASRELVDAIRDFQSFEGMKTGQDYRNDEIIKKAGIRLSELRYSKTAKEEAIKKLVPSAYSVLACLNTYGGDTFKDFCANFGYDEDSRMAEKTFKAVQEQENNLRRLFSFEQLDALNEIN